MARDRRRIGSRDRQVRQPYNLNATSQAVASAVIAEAWDSVRAHVDIVVAERDRVARAITPLSGFDVAPSHAELLVGWNPAPR